MNREKKELMEHKFEKLSDANKIRYNLGNIMLMQFSGASGIMILGLTNLAYLLILPFVLKYFRVSSILMLAFLGILTMIGIFILYWIMVSKLNKSEKALEDFLNKKSKK